MSLLILSWSNCRNPGFSRICSSCNRSVWRTSQSLRQGTPFAARRGASLGRPLPPVARRPEPLRFRCLPAASRCLRWFRVVPQSLRCPDGSRENWNASPVLPSSLPTGWCRRCRLRLVRNLLSSFHVLLLIILSSGSAEIRRWVRQNLGAVLRVVVEALIEDVRVLQPMTGTRSGGRCVGPAGTSPDYA